ncbi:hypothetical protein GW765_00365 [Candidatus Parcubacteria bacterium]|nr:hypothetical protein [Candidatus Parcubacteria bacterium]
MITLDKQQDYLAERIVILHGEYMASQKKTFSFPLDPKHFKDLKVYFGEENKPKKVLHPCPDFEGDKVYVGKDD